MSLDKMLTSAIRQVALELVKTDPRGQLEFLATYAKNMSSEALDDIAAEVNAFAGEEESIALCRLARAINERDAGPAIGDDC